MKQAQTKVSPIIATKQLSEDAGAFWFECHLANGKVVLMSVPK